MAAINLSVSKFNATIFALAASKFIFPARSSATIRADSFAALFVKTLTAGKMSSNCIINSLLTVPVAAIVLFKVSISAFDCIPKVAIIACHLAASPETIPVDTPFAVVSPGTFGNCSFI